MENTRKIMTPKKILLIITGSVACYKSLELIRLLRKNNYEVNCVLSKGAKEFITPLLVSSLSGTKTYDELFNNDDEVQMGHINLSRANDLIVVAPASADFIAKIANGYGDDLASASILASNKKIIIAPAMNEKMWNNLATQENICKIEKIGHQIIEPQRDLLACGEEGVGKMADIEKIYENILQYFQNKAEFNNKNILITLGGTIEMIDPVRFIGNKSSGKQGMAIAKYFQEAGANVKIIAGNISQKINFPIKTLFNVRTAQEMFEEVKRNLSEVDIFISCSAVSDYKIKNYSEHKIKKSQQGEPILYLEQNPDILQYVGTCTQRPKIVVGFCAESENLAENAKQKLLNKNCDIVVANHIDNGKIFGSDFTSGTILQKDLKFYDFENISKNKLAENLAKLVIKLLK